jgi:signal peptidase II
MAFGWELGSKLFLTIFRIIVSGAVIWYLVRLMRDGYKLGYQIVVTLVLAGALGNIIDCVFYGKIFSESSYFEVAEFMPAAGGYAGWFMGKVVDMFYFPLFTFPDWVPFLGGEIFFSPIFNLADSYITVAIFMLIIFYHKDFNKTIELYTTRDR